MSRTLPAAANSATMASASDVDMRSASPSSLQEISVPVVRTLSDEEKTKLAELLQTPAFSNHHVLIVAPQEKLGSWLRSQITIAEDLGGDVNALRSIKIEDLARLVHDFQASCFITQTLSESACLAVKLFEASKLILGRVPMAGFPRSVPDEAKRARGLELHLTRTKDGTFIRDVGFEGDNSEHRLGEDWSVFGPEPTKKKLAKKSKKQVPGPFIRSTDERDDDDEGSEDGEEGGIPLLTPGKPTEGSGRELFPRDSKNNTVEQVVDIARNNGRPGATTAAYIRHVLAPDWFSRDGRIWGGEKTRMLLAAVDEKGEPLVKDEDLGLFGEKARLNRQRVQQPSLYNAKGGVRKRKAAVFEQKHNQSDGRFGAVARIKKNMTEAGLAKTIQDALNDGLVSDAKSATNFQASNEETILRQKAELDRGQEREAFLIKMLAQQGRNPEKWEDDMKIMAKSLSTNDSRAITKRLRHPDFTSPASSTSHRGTQTD